MRFKIVFNDVQKVMDINCMNDDSKDIIFPTNPEQHLHYPVPLELSGKVKSELMPVLSEDMSKAFIDLDKEIKNLTDRRREMMNNMRKELNPKLLLALEKFKADNAEYFI